MSGDTSRSFRRWPAVADGLAGGAAFFLLSYCSQGFQQLLVAPALIYAAVAAALTGWTAGGVWRAIWLYPLLVAAAIVTPLAVVLEPAPVLVGLLSTVVFFTVLRPRYEKRRAPLLVAAWAMMLFAVVTPLTLMPLYMLRFLPGVLAFGVVTAAALWQPDYGRRPAAALALALSLAALPTVSARFMPCDERLRAPVVLQPGIETVFDNNTSLEIPVHRMELLCDAGAQMRVVTPRHPSARVGLLPFDQPPASVLLNGEASARSVLRDGVLYTGAKGAINALDLRTQRLQVGPRLAEHNLGLLHYGPDGDLLAGVESEGSYCYLAHRDTLGGAGHVPMAAPGACVPVGLDRLLISSLGWPGRRLELRRVSDGAVLRSRGLVDVGFLDMAVDLTARRVYAPSTLLGLVYVLDLDTLALRGWFRSRTGVRGALLDASGKRLFTYTYFDGEVLEHELPGGQVVKSWRVGGPLRGLTWDCDGRALLATSCLGGFRIVP